MSMLDFKKNFRWVNYTANPRNWKHSYWMALGDGDTIGAAGTSSFCGSTCKKVTFEITSTVA